MRRHPGLGFFPAERLVGRNRLSRRGPALTGLSTLGLMHERRLLEAPRLLASAADAVAELGLQDLAYLVRCFFRRAGCAPLAYRAALQRGDAVAP